MTVYLFQASEWAAIFKQVGVIGAVCLFFGAIIWRVFIPMMRETVADARKERDAARQLLKEQATEFTEHIKSENEQFREALKGVVDGFERGRRR